jgi:hypothetical protein
MDSNQDMGGAQADHMLKLILNKMNEQKSDMERNVARQLDLFKEELQGATSSVSSEVKQMKKDKVILGRIQVIRISMNTMRRFLIL